MTDGEMSVSGLVAWECIAEADPSVISPHVYRGALIAAIEEVKRLRGQIIDLQDPVPEKAKRDLSAEREILKLVIIPPADEPTRH